MTNVIKKNRDSGLVPSRYWIGNEFPSVLNTRSWDKIFDSFFNSGDFLTDPFAIQRELLGTSSSVPYDVIKTTDDNGNETGLEMQFAVAGYKKDDIKIEYDTQSGILTISAEKSSKEEEDKSKYLYKGIKRSSWSVSYMLSSNVDKDGLRSDLKNGTLKVTIPYVAEMPSLESPIKKIEIQSEQLEQQQLPRLKGVGISSHAFFFCIMTFV